MIYSSYCLYSSVYNKYVYYDVTQHIKFTMNLHVCTDLFTQFNERHIRLSSPSEPSFVENAKTAETALVNRRTLHRFLKLRNKQSLKTKSCVMVLI